MHRVVDAVLAFLDLDLAAAADPDDRDAARQLGQALLQLLAIVIGCRLFDLRSDLVGASEDVVLAAGTVDDRRVLFLNSHPLGAAEHV